MKKIPLKNYYLFGLLVIVTSLLLIYVMYYDFEKKQYDLSIPVLNNYIDEIKENEIKDYIRDNGDITVYACKISNNYCRSFEKQFRRTIKKYNLSDKIVYLNINESSAFKPGFFVHNNRELSRELIISINEEIDYTLIFEFLKENGVILSD